MMAQHMDRARRFYIYHSLPPSWEMLQIGPDDSWSNLATTIPVLPHHVLMMCTQTAARRLMSNENVYNRPEGKGAGTLVTKPNLVLNFLEQPNNH